MTDLEYFDRLVADARTGDELALAALAEMRGRHDAEDLRYRLAEAHLDAEHWQRHSARQVTDRNWWRTVAITLLGILVVVAMLLQPARAEQREPEVQASCWRFDVLGQRRLVWTATGSAAHWIVRDGQDVLQVEQSARVVEHVVADGEACIVGPRVWRDE